MAGAIEYNEAKHVGVKPAVDQDSIRIYSRIPEWGNEVVATGVANNSTVTVYTVAAGKTLYLTHANVDLTNNSGAVTFSATYISTGGGGVYFRLANAYLPAGNSKGKVLIFNPPMEVPATYYFVLASGVLNAPSYLSIHGFTD